jgi:ribosome-associated protein
LDWNIILSELSYRTSRSSGAGGQHVNKTETKVEVLFDVGVSAGLSQDEKDLIFQKLGARISDDGFLSVTSQKERSQLANKEHVIERLEAMLIKALTPTIKRIRTRPTKTSIEDRLQEKKKTAEKKELRKRPKI